ncbi:MAG: FAD-dependent oxidoreductase, partial [Clostridia bacterium]|nr:FAD-dependent oxidoreductase [Clostridia bacterium]
EELGVRFEDSIGSTGDFRYRGKHYHVPYRCLYNAEYPNLLAAGRIVSAVGDGMEVLRVIPSCALTGQAAGIAASLAIDANVSVANVNVPKLQKELKARNALFED